MLEGIVGSFELSEDYGIFEIPTPNFFIGKSVMESNLRQTYNLNLVTIKRIKKKGGLKTLGSQDETLVMVYLRRI